MNTWLLFGLTKARSARPVVALGLGCALFLTASLANAAAPVPDPPTPTAPANTAPPGSADAAATAPPDAQWPMFNGTYDSQRFSALAQIDASNASTLKEVCRVRVGSAGGFPNGPLLVGKALYVTAANATLSIDATDCAVNWKTLWEPEGKGRYSPATRGAGYADGRIFRGTGDARVIALDAASGREVWRTTAGDPTAGEWITAAPTIWDGKVYVGIAGSEFGVRGRMLAFDAKTGQRLWQFNTVPQDSEPGVETWKGDTWKTGGGGTWSSTTLDPESAELFVPVGNPAPDLSTGYRQGSNLYTNSVVALNANSGKLLWYYQTTPNDDRDYDQGSAPMLFTMANGQKALAAGSKDGYLRVISRKTHKLIYQLAVTTVDAKKKPVTEEGITVCPGVLGGVQWNGPAYDSANKAIIVGAVDWCTVLAKKKEQVYERGKDFTGGTMKNVDSPRPSGWITSLDADTGKVRWKFHVPSPVVSGITPTAGGVIFVGDVSGRFYALRAKDGEVLFQTDTGGGVSGGVVTYTVDQKQYVAITSGNLSRNMWGAPGLPHIVIYSLPDAMAHVVTGPPDVERGRAVFARACSGCHGATGEGATGPALKLIGIRFSTNALIDQIRDPKAMPGAARPTMPKLFPTAISAQDVADVAAWLGAL